MKFKTLSLFIAACSIATASFAQQEKPHTEVKVRDNGTKKITTVRADGSETVTKTGKTNLGAAADNTVDAAGNVLEKGVKVVKRGAKKTGKAVKKGTEKTTGVVKKGTSKMEAKTE